MTAARLFLVHCLIWLLTLASPAGAGHLVIADLQDGIAQSVFAGLQEGAPERLPGQSDDEYFAVYNAWKNDVAGQANLLGAVFGYMTSGGQAVNVSNAASIAQSGALNNYLGHTDLAVLADRLAECRADGACTEEELFSIRDEMLARSLANDEALASCLTQACVEEHLAAVAGLDAFREIIGTDEAARQIIASALQRNAGVDVGLLAVLGVRGGTSGPTFGPQDWALARAALNVANAETILQQCGQDAACMIAVANEIQADEAFVDLLRDLPGIGGVIAANDCAMTGDALTCAAVSVEAFGAAGDMLQNGRRVLLRMGEDTVPATVRTTDEGVEVVTDAGDVVRVADEVKLLPAPNSVGSARRNEPGVASHGGSLPTIREGDDWLRGTDGNAGRVPSQIAERLAGREFRDFDHFREEFWKAAASDPILSQQFTPQNRVLMSDGLAPFAPSTQQQGGRVKYELDHNQALQNGGNVYDMNNIIIRTPLNHIAGK